MMDEEYDRLWNVCRNMIESAYPERGDVDVAWELSRLRRELERERDGGPWPALDSECIDTDGTIVDRETGRAVG